MTNDQLLDDLHAIQYTACINQRYNQRLASHRDVWDRIIKIAVGVASVAGLVLTFTGPNAAEIAIGVVSLIAAITLNIVPVSDWAQHYRMLFAHWTDLRSETEEIQLEIGLDAGSDPASEFYIRRLISLKSRRHDIEVDEAAPNRRLLEECQRHENKFRKIPDEPPASEPSAWELLKQFWKRLTFRNATT